MHLNLYKNKNRKITVKNDLKNENASSNVKKHHVSLVMHSYVLIFDLLSPSRLYIKTIIKYILFCTSHTVNYVFFLVQKHVRGYSELKHDLPQNSMSG